MCPSATWDSGRPARARPSQEVLPQGRSQELPAVADRLCGLGQDSSSKPQFPICKMGSNYLKCGRGCRAQHSAEGRSSEDSLARTSLTGNEELTPGAAKLSAGMQFPLEALAQVRRRNASER